MILPVCGYEVAQAPRDVGSSRDSLSELFRKILFRHHHTCTLGVYSEGTTTVP